MPDGAIEAYKQAVDLRIGILKPKKGDVVIVKVAKQELLARLYAMMDWLKGVMPDGVEVIMIGPGIDISVMTREELDAHAAQRQEPERSPEQSDDH